MFRPVVMFVRKVVGTKEFNKLRGKAIAIHSQVITDFCKFVGAQSQIRQGLIRVAKANGSKLGFID